MVQAQDRRPGGDSDSEHEEEDEWNSLWLRTDRGIRKFLKLLGA